jgi:hypothetical protein
VVAALRCQLRRLQLADDDQLLDAALPIDFAAELTSPAAVLGALHEASRGEASLRVMHALGTAARATIARASAGDTSFSSRYSTRAREHSKKLMIAELVSASRACGASLPNVRQALDLGGESAAPGRGLFEGQLGGASDAPVSRQPLSEDEEGDGDTAGKIAALLSAQVDVKEVDDDGEEEDFDAAAGPESASGADEEAEAATAAAAAAAAAARGGRVPFPRPPTWGSVEEARISRSPFATEPRLLLCAVSDSEQLRAQELNSMSAAPPGVSGTRPLPPPHPPHHPPTPSLAVPALSVPA